MKKYRLILLLSSLLAFTACEEYLDKSPDLGISEDVVFNNYFSIRGYLDKCYNCVVDYSYWKAQEANRAHVGQMSDEAANPYTSTQITNFINKGIWQNTEVAPEIGWTQGLVGSINGRAIPNAFLGLRISNRIIEKVPDISILTEQQKTELLGQAYFFRAWFYFEVIRRVGGMPALDKVYGSDDDMDMPRMTYQQSTEWLIEQVEKAIELLPHEWPSTETGRPNKVAGYALKEMAALYASSPLMANPIDRVEDNGYDTEWAKKAAQYAKECLEYIDNTVPKHKMMDGANYKNIFYHFPNFVSDESLWYVNTAGMTRTGPRQDVLIFWIPQRMAAASGNYADPNVSVSQNLVDKFETKNGYSAILTESGWVSDDPAFDPDHPYENRDPRFHAFILHPGEQYGTYANGSPNYVCTWEGGADISPVATTGRTVRTGYLVKKWLWPEAIPLNRPNKAEGYTKYYWNCIHIRTTQVWLDYAEAMNEAYGPKNIPAGYTYSAVDAINKVRNRVGMINVRSEKTTDATTFREVIRNERAVELLLEHNRWFDIRRWMIAESLLSVPNPIKGVRAVPSNATSLKPNPGNIFTFQRKDVPEEIRVFERKHYWYPFPKNETDRFVHFKQNPGWN